MFNRAHVRLPAIVVLLGLTAVVNGQVLDDPMRPSTARPATPVSAVRVEPEPERFDPARYEVQSLYVMDQVRRAEISGRTYHIGDDLGAAEIIAIDATQVVVQAHGTRFRLPLAQSGATFRIMEKGE
ncbi:hypothetical protein [Salinispirillum marinum]